MPLTQHHRHYFTIEQRETLQRLMEARAAVLRDEIGEDVKANLDAEPEAVSLRLDVIELRAIEAALERLHTPDFGLCEACAEEISYARLAANPTAVRCLGCQTRRERGAGRAPKA